MFRRTLQVAVLLSVVWCGLAVNVGLLLVLIASPVAASEIKIHNVEYPSRLFGKGGAVVTVESNKKSEVKCTGYKDGVPVGSGSGKTTAGIANVTVFITQKAGRFTVKCF